MTTYFDGIPSAFRQSFKRVRRTSGGGVDSYGDATFTELTTSGFKGFFQFGQRPGETVILAGKEIAYDGIVYASATMILSESDRLLFGSSTSTSIATRYVVKGVVPIYEKGVPNHKEIFVSQEIV